MTNLTKFNQLATQLERSWDNWKNGLRNYERMGLVKGYILENRYIKQLERSVEELLVYEFDRLPHFLKEKVEKRLEEAQEVINRHYEH